MTETIPSSATREVVRRVTGRPTSDGAGVKLRRVIGQPALPDLDPFLMLDAFGSDAAADYLAGFPEHPHRGFETVTYMLEGRMRHRDNQGNSGLLTPGSVQWMTAGRGILHSEMPEQESGRMAGFQLWVNLPARDKMTAPRYQDIPSERIPEVRAPGSLVRVIAGRYGDVDGPVNGIATEPIYLDVRLEPGVAFVEAIPATHRAFAYIYEGAAAIGEAAAPVSTGELAVLGDGADVRVRAADNGARLLVVAGRPLDEPIARYGPIVMNTEAEVRAAFDDLRTGRF